MLFWVIHGLILVSTFLWLLVLIAAWQLGAIKMIGRILTLLRSSAASSFFWMSSRDRSLFGGLAMQWAMSDTGEDGFRMTSKAWPEARFLMGLMSMSACAYINRKESLCVTFHSSCLIKGIKISATYLQSHPWCFCWSQGTDRSRWMRELRSPSSSPCKLRK